MTLRRNENGYVIEGVTDDLPDELYKVKSATAGLIERIELIYKELWNQ